MLENWIRKHWTELGDGTGLFDRVLQRLSRGGMNPSIAAGGRRRPAGGSMYQRLRWSPARTQSRHGDGRDRIAGNSDTFWDGDVNQLVSILLPRLRRRLRGTFAFAASEQVDDAVTDAIIEYIGAIRADRLMSQMGPSVESHLYRAAWRNLANALESERRRRLREDRYGRMREWIGSDSRSVDTFNPAQDTWSRLRLLAADDTDLRALRLWFDGARAGAIADALDCCDRSPEQQRADVKRFKDRIRKRARRSR